MNQEAETAALQRENRRLRRRIQKLEERYRMTLGSISEIYFETDTKGRLTFFNASLCAITGFSKSTLQGKIARDLCPRESARKLEAMFRTILEIGENRELLHIDILHKQGHSIPLEISLSAIRAQGNLDGFRGIARDIRSKRAMEKEKAMFQEQLQHAQKLEAIGTLAAGLAHDFNNLLMGIQGNVSLLLLHTEPESPSWQRLMKIETQVQYGADLTRKLLGFSRDHDYSPGPCDINALVEDTCLLFSRSRKNLEVRQTLAPGLPPVMADRAQISQALLYILINAATHAMPEGGRLFVETEAIFLESSFVQPYRLFPGDYVRILIRDTGKGMDGPTRKRIFEPFFTTLEKGQGTGLGLTSAFSIIKNHQGILSVESLPGQGCTFLIHLPSIRQNRRQPGQPNHRLTVLLVDDEAVIREVASELLQELGHTSLTASGGREGLALFDQHADIIDLVILDMVMPGMHGSEVLSALRTRAPGLPVLISSGYEPITAENPAHTRHCTGFIQKPFTLKSLEKTLAMLCSNTGTA
ncbi:PAS domain S-box protein [Desulfobotulus sp. H1]|uniref:histidine kinase n=1 Tax=Desulfobotulus pelophilus TaxID=2823377 RepID=A0ABT3N6W5_9BACT|nr:response regulator [Desulfobotulus pelophilus]MCW7753198.1 PAS domain S-box protein [Desulfobotulus pelophilus]